MIAKSIAERVLLCAMSTGADFVELFAEKTRTSSISLADAKARGYTSCDKCVDH